MRAPFLTILLVLTATIAPQARGAGDKDPVLLRLSLKPGGIFRLDLTQTASQFMSMGGIEITTEISSTSSSTTTVDDVTLDRSTITTNVNMGTSHLTIRGPEELKMSRDTTIDLSSISPMMVTKATLDKRGTVLSQVNPVDPTAKGILATLRLYEMFTVPFPAKAVRVGDSWTTLRNDTIPMPTGGGTLVSRVELKHTFRGVRDTLGVRCWVIETVSTTLEQSGSVTTAAGDFALDGTGQVTNRAYLEAGTGITMALSSESTVQLQMAITGQQSMVIPLDMQTRLTAVRRMPSR